MKVRQYGKEYDTDNLPVWAREFITRLQSARDGAEMQLQNFLNDQTPSQIWTDLWHGHDLTRRYINGDRSINFSVGNGGVIAVYESHDRPGQLTIMATSGRALQVHPASSNVIRVATEDL